MNANWKSPDRKQFLWPLSALALGALVATNPFYLPQITLKLGIAAWFVDMALALMLSWHPVTLRLAVIVAGVFMAVPCFLQASPMLRFLLMCWMALPLVIAALQLFAAPSAGYRERLAYVFSWLGTREVQWRVRRFAIGSLIQCVIATLMFAIALSIVKSVSPTGMWLLVRWFAGVIMAVAFAEMATASHYFLTALIGINAPALMRSPCLAVSLREFWAERWNPAASVILFHRYFFAPLARRGVGLALMAAFVGSAVAHVLLLFMATERWGISLMWGTFFLVQPLLIVVERRMRVRHWTPAAGRTWTIAALALTSPLFVEPALQLVEPSWGGPDNLVLPTAAVLSFVILVNGLFVGIACIQAKPDNAESFIAPDGGLNPG